MTFQKEGMHFLIAGDDRESLKLLQHYLEEEFSVPQILVFELSKIISLPCESPIDCIIMDCRTTDCEESIKKVASLYKLPVIAIVSDKEMGEKLLSLNISDYIETNTLTPSLLSKTIKLSISQNGILKKLQECEERYDNLFHLSPNPKFIYDTDTLLLLDVNKIAEEKYGYAREDLLKMKVTEFLAPSELEGAMLDIQDFRAGKMFSESFLKSITKSGNVIDIITQSNPLIFNSKNARIVLATDVTEKLQTKKENALAEERFKALVQDGSELIAILNSDGIFMYISPNVKSNYGLDPQDYIGINAFERLHPDEASYFYDQFSELKTKKRLATKPFRYIEIDGHWRWLEANVVDMTDNPSVNGIVLNARDVTERIENEIKIKESNLRYEAVAQATSDAIYEYDATTQEIYIAGSNYGKIFGFDLKDQYVDVSFWHSRLHPDESEWVREQISLITEDVAKKHYEIEYRFRRQDDTYAYVLDRFSIVWKNGKHFKKIGALQDITTKKFQETILAFEKDIYKLNASPRATLKSVLDKAIEFLENAIPGAMCYIGEFRRNKLIHLAGDSLPTDYLLSLKKMGIENDAFIFPNENTFISDLENAAIWKKYASVSKAYSMKSCWSIPIRKTDAVTIAAFVVHFKQCKQPDSNETYILERVASLSGVLIENRRSGEELKQAIDRYEIVAKATSDTIWDWKIQEDNFTWNKGIREMFGYKKNEVENNSKWWFDRIHPEDSIRVSVKLYNFLEKKLKNWQDEYRFRCADGTYKFILDRGFLIKDDNQKSVRMIASMQDITKQKQEEQRLKLLETVITHAKDAVVITDTEIIDDQNLPKIVFANQAFSEMSGYSLSEIIGQPSSIFYGPKSDKNEYSKMVAALREKKEAVIETIRYKKNKEEYWVNFSMIPVADKNGDISHWISIQKDITEQKRQEKEKEQLIRELTQNNKDLKQFSYIISHNLRAPLSNLTGLLNLIEDIPIENEELQLILNGFKKSTYLLNETINDLVKVVIIKDNPSVIKENVNINEVFENVFMQLNYLFDLHEPILKINLEKNTLLNINKSYLESIMLNLLTNSIKYRNPENKLKISISTKEKDNEIQLIFKDNGIGIDLQRNKDKIFGLYQRFHNYPDSKGLGLYLVKSQVETMGGTINVQSRVNKGTKFTITFNSNRNDK